MFFQLFFFHFDFRCSRAKQLFELVQRNVHRNQEEQSSRRISLGTIIDQGSNPAEPLSPPPVFEPVVPPINTSLASPPAVVEFTNAQYMNVEPRSQQQQISQFPTILPTTPTSLVPSMVSCF